MKEFVLHDRRRTMIKMSPHKWWRKDTKNGRSSSWSSLIDFKMTSLIMSPFFSSLISSFVSPFDSCMPDFNPTPTGTNVECERMRLAIESGCRGKFYVILQEPSKRERKRMVLEMLRRERRRKFEFPWQPVSLSPLSAQELLLLIPLFK